MILVSATHEAGYVHSESYRIERPIVSVSNDSVTIPYSRDTNVLIVVIVAREVRDVGRSSIAVKVPL